MGNFGILMQCLLGVREENEYLISMINEMQQNSTNPLVIEECIYLLSKYVPNFGTECKKRKIETTTHAIVNDSDDVQINAHELETLLNRSVATEKTPLLLTPYTSPGTVQESSQQERTPVKDSFAIPKPPHPLATPSEDITMAHETSVTSFDSSNLSDNHKVFFSMLDDESYFLCCISKTISLTLQSSLISTENVCSNPLPPIKILDHETVSKASVMDLDEQLKTRIQDESGFLQSLRNITHSQFFNNLLNLCKRDQSLTKQLWRNCFAWIMKTTVGQEYYLSLGPSLLEKFKKGFENALPRSYISFAEELLQHIPLSSSLLGVINCFMKVPYLKRPVCMKLEDIVFENNESGIITDLRDQCIDILAECYRMIPENEYLGGLLKAFSTRKFENMETFEDVGKRSANELSEWKFLTHRKFDDCNYVRHRDCFNCRCPCDEYKKDDKKLAKFIYLLCGNKMIYADAYQNELSKLQDDFAVELQHIPAMFSTEHMELLKNCARVNCFKEAFFIMKKLVTEPNIPFVYEHYLKPFLLTINQEDMFELDICGARLRIFAYFISNVDLREDIATDLANEMKSVAFREFNKCYTKLAIESMKYGLQSLVLKFQNKYKSLPRDGIGELTENYIFYQKYLKNPFAPKGKSLLDWLNTICQTIGFARQSNSVSMCKTFLGKLLSASGDTQKATSAFRESLCLSDYHKTHELFGIHLEKKFLGEESKCFDDAKRVIQHLLEASGYVNENRIQVLLTKILGLLAYDVNSYLEKAVLNWAYTMPKYHWISMLPQLLKLASNSTAGPDGFNRLLLLLDKEYLPLIFFEFTALEYKSPTLLKTFNELKKRNPSLISNLESLDKELLCLQEKFCDESFIKLKALEVEICELAYEFSQMMSLYSFCEDQFTEVQHKQRFVRRFNQLLNKIELPWAYRCQQVTEETDLKQMWDILLELLEALSNFTDTQQKTSFPIQKVYSGSYFSTLHLDTKGIIMFGTDVKKVKEVIYVQKILPRLEIMQKHNSLACKISIKGTDGKEYDYLVVPKSCTHLIKQDRIFSRLFSFLNNVLKKERTSLRSLHFNFFEVTAFPSVELIKYNKDQVSYLDICKKPVFGKKPILEYFKTLGRTNLYTDNEFRTSFFQEIERSIPSITLKEWAKATYTSSHDYWMFRRKFSCDIGLVNYAKYCFLLTYLNPNLMYIDRKTGEIAAFGLKLAELNPEQDFEAAIFQKTKLHCPPYQLTPNIREFLTPAGVYGIMASAIEITAQCFLKNLDDIESLLRLLIPSVLKNQTINRPTLKDNLDTIKTHDTCILPNWVQLVETTLPLSEADNYDELSGTFLFRQTFSPCQENLWCLLCCCNLSFRSVADLVKHYNSIHDVGVIIKNAKFNKEVYFVPASMINEQEDEVKKMSSSTDCQKMSSSTDCQKMSSSSVCQKMSTSIRCHICKISLKTPSQVHEHYKNAHYKPARLVPKSDISNIGYYFHCGLCNKASRFFLHHHQHMKMEHQLQMHMCNDCAYCKQITIDPKSHFNLEYLHDQIEECPVCSKRGDLTKHSILHHTYQTGQKSFACRACLHSYSNLHQFMNHIPICPDPWDHPTLGDDGELSKSVVFSCDKCPFTFVQEYKDEVKQNKQKEVENYIEKVITLITGSSLKDQEDIRLRLIKDSLEIKNRSLMNPYTHPWL